MGNQEIARVIAEIADVLEIKGENPFKIRAYTRAAQAIRSLTEELGALRQRGPLTNLPGIGKSIADKIEELLDTGKCKFHRDLLAEFPPEMIDLLRIPEVGPKTVMLLHRQLGISNISMLEQAAREGKLRGIPGMGAKTEENILKGIERLRRFRARLPLAIAHPHALQIVALLRERAPLDQIEPAGSLRRMREDIGDLDILVTSSQPQKVMEAFVNLPMVTERLAHGPTKSMVVTDVGVQVDVRVVEPNDLGAALQYFTGSKGHNIKLRELAVKRGLKISEYGIFEVKTERRLGGKTEQEIYDVLKLPCPPPEIREDTGEIELMLKGKLPPLVETKDIKGDLHVHTHASDGRQGLKEMVEGAREMSYRYIAITEHSPTRTIARGLRNDDLLRHIEAIRKLNDDYDDFTVLAGAEVDIKGNGDLDYPDEILAQLDLVVASIHSGFKMEEEAMTRRIVTALGNPYLDILGHPTGRLIGERDPYQVDIEQVFAAALEHSVAMEINAFPERLDLKDVHARRAKELGLKIVVSTDAHSADHYHLMRYGVATARRGWLAPEDVLNTLPWSKLRKQLRRNRALARAR